MQRPRGAISPGSSPTGAIVTTSSIGNLQRGHATESDTTQSCNVLQPTNAPNIVGCVLTEEPVGRAGRCGARAEPLDPEIARCAARRLCKLLVILAPVGGGLFPWLNELATRLHFA